MRLSKLEWSSSSSVWLIVLVRVRLRLEPFANLRHYLGLRAAEAGNADATKEQVARAVKAIGRRLPGTTCLAEALVGYTMLQRHGHAAVLRIGVRRDDAARLGAHAWVECEGMVAIGTLTTPTDYAVLS